MHCSRRGRWECAIRTPLIADYDRRPLEVTVEAKNVAGKKLQGCFFQQRNSAKYSLGAAMLDTMQSAKPDWPSPSPDAYKLRCDAWRTALHFDGEPDLMKRTWMSLLAMPGYVLFHPQHATHGGLVCK